MFYIFLAGNGIRFYFKEELKIRNKHSLHIKLLLLCCILASTFIAKQVSANETPTGYTRYDVSNYNEFKNAITASSGIKKYIVLNADITYGFSNGVSTTSHSSVVESIYFNSDTIIDGSDINGVPKYKLLFGYTSSDGYFATSSPFRTITPNISIEYRNVTIGDTSHSILTNAGLLYPYTDTGTPLNLNLSLQNASIYLTNGTPFNSYYATNSTLTFKGTNTITSLSGTDFSNGFKNVIFDKESHTLVNFEGAEDSTQFKGDIDTSGSVGELNINVLSGAEVNMNNGNTNFLQSSKFNMILEEDSIFNYNQVQGKVNKSKAVINSNNNSTNIVTVGKSSTLNFSSTNPAMTSWVWSGLSNTINANAPKSIMFSKSNSSGSILSGNLNIKRTDSVKEYDYQASTLDPGKTTTSNYINYMIADSNTVSGNSTLGKTLWIYEPKVAITTLSTSSTVAAGQSDLNVGKMLSYTTSDAVLNQINYKISGKSLVMNDDITSQGSQNNITDVSDENLVAKATLTTDPNYTVNNLVAQTYYAYGQISCIKNYDNDAVGNFTTISTSKWVETPQVIERGIYVKFPDSVNFTSPNIGNYNSKVNTITNMSNVPITLKVASFTKTQSEFSIIDNVMSGSKHATTLNLNFYSPSMATPLIMSANNIDSNTTMYLSAYTDKSKNYVTFNFSGNYSGPLDGEKKGAYKLGFSVSG